ncbi:hypothetical protein [Serratia entomophila]|uniref:hypothetical protein n=1 Tax=Serratia entomophila TaxID=42906 RepID=UPI00217A317D|nr:hypothetical protein [Serratia entomophila]CAI1744293.1 Uncharacterised protein [Serratia entomophila]
MTRGPTIDEFRTQGAYTLSELKRNYDGFFSGETMTLTTEQLKGYADEFRKDAAKWGECGETDKARELNAVADVFDNAAANREAQPVALVDRRPAASGSICWQNGGVALPHGTELFTAPPAPAVQEKPRLAPHVYRDLLDMLQEAAIAYGGTQQLRAQLSSALSIHVQPDHPHTRAAALAQPVSQGYKLPEGWKPVPVEPTAEMINAALASGALSIRTAYRVMLAAAPEQSKPADHVWVKCAVCGYTTHQHFDHCGTHCGEVMTAPEGGNGA